MNTHIILSKIQRDKLLIAKKLIQPLLDKRHIDLDPVELLDGNFALPVEVLKIFNFPDLKKLLKLLPTKDLDPMEVRGNQGIIGI